MSKQFTKNKTIARQPNFTGTPGTGTVTSIGITSTDTSITINSGSPVTTTGSIDLTANAMIIVDDTYVAAQTTSLPAVKTIAVGASDTCFQFIGFTTITASTGTGFSSLIITVNYTDQNNTSKSTIINNTIPVAVARCKAGTNIVIDITSTYTTITYDAEIITLKNI